MLVRSTVALCLLLAPASLHAQPTSTSSVPWHPTIGLPLPTIGLPHPPMGLPPLDTRSLLPTTSPVPVPGGGQVFAPPGGVVGPRRGANVFFFPFLLGPVVPGAVSARPGVSVSPPIAPPRSPARGTVWLEIEPSTTVQVYVDEFYVGETDGHGGRLELEAGPRSLELRAPGYEPLRFRVYVERDRTMTYRDSFIALRNDGSAKRSSPGSASAPANPAPGAPAASKPMTLYVIPGCYAGNVPPDEAVLPEGCDKARATSIIR